MPTFTLHGQVTVSASIEIKADTLESAIKKSENLSVMHSSEANGVSEEVWIVEEIDGSVCEIYSGEQ
ncbi:hypothetical protein OKZ62_001885 [Vibrio navarrensis]|nr:hypothetical protein [Vibrio navarrensis]